MDTKTIDFYQIYYEDFQLSELYPFAKPHKNEVLTNYFENSIISDLVPASNADLISVCSWRLRQKRSSGPCEIILKSENTFELTEESILSKDYDVAILTPRRPSHDILAFAENWHSKAITIAFNALRPIIRVPDKLIGNAIYENHFIARGEIYHDYVNHCLKPAIEFIGNNELFFADANYANKKTADERKRYTAITGRKDWPLAPFVLERLFRIWIDRKLFKIINL